MSGIEHDRHEQPEEEDRLLLSLEKKFKRLEEKKQEQVLLTELDDVMKLYEAESPKLP